MFSGPWPNRFGALSPGALSSAAVSSKVFRVGMTWIYLFRWGVYTAVVLNAVYYFYLDVQSTLILGPGLPLIDWLGSFSTTIDYVGWLLLVGLFQLQKGLSEKEPIKRGKVWAFGLSTAMAFLCLGLALYLYVLDFGYYDHYTAYPADRVCAESEAPLYFLNQDQIYEAVTTQNCGALAAGTVLAHSTDGSLIEEQNRVVGAHLALVNVFNAIAWLALVLVFQLDLVIQRARPDWQKALEWCNRGKVFFYVVLFANAIYWFWYGTWVDAWDAFLWIFAFLALELVSSEEEPEEEEA